MKKKNIFRRRGFAIILCVLLIIISTALSVSRSLGKKCRDVGNGFYTGVYSAAYKTNLQSIETQLNKRVGAATGLLTISAAYPELQGETDALRKAKDALQSAETIKQKYTANERLASVFFACSEKLETMDKSPNTREMIDTYTVSFKAAQELIDSSGYNEAVKEFNRSTLNKFPANILKIFIISDLPVLFSS